MPDPCEKCGVAHEPSAPCPRYDWDTDATSQDVIDALRFILMGQKDPAEALKIVTCLVEFAPETGSNRGMDLVLHMIAEGSLKVALTDA